ncbi:MAG: DUF4342 domain-containing protein [Candidatus Moraniibacteriota bacterium]
MKKENNKEEFRVSGDRLIEKIKKIIKGGNARRVIIQNEKGKTLIEIPLTITVIGAALAPVLAAVGAIAALVTKCTIIVERK